MNLGRYVAALKRYKWLILGMTLVGTVAGIGISQFISPIYEASATVWVAGNSDPKQGPIRSPQTMDTQAWMELVQSFAILEPVAIEQRLYIQPENAADTTAFRGFQPSSNLLTGAYSLAFDAQRYTLTSISESGETIVERGAVGDSIGRPVGFWWAPPATDLGQPRTIKFDVLSPREAALDLRSRMTVTLRPLSSFINLKLSGTRPQELANSLNFLLNRFTNEAEYLKKRELTEMSNILEEQLDVAERQLKVSENGLERFRAAAITQPSEAPAVAGLQLQAPPAISAHQNLRVQLDNARRDREALQKIVADARQGAISAEALWGVPTVLATSQDLKNALNDLSGAQANLRALQQRFTDEHPLVKDARAKIEDMQTRVIPQIAQGTLTTLRQQESELDRRISDASREIQAIPARTIEEARLTREKDVADNLYRNLKQRHAEAKLAEASAVPDVSVLDAAVAPVVPSSNTAPTIIGLGIVVGLGLGLLIAILLDQLDKRFRYPEQATRELGLDVLGGVPTINRSKRGQLRIEEAAQLVEAFRALRLNVRSAVDSGPVALTVSSPGAGDGKSTISSNLAMSFAESGYRTLLIDGDIRRGQLHESELFNVPQRPGLIDYLMGDASLDEVVHETRFQNLFLLPCGTRRQRGPELLAADGTAKLLRLLRQKFDAVIVDSAPLGAGIDPFALGAATGNMLIVLRTGRTDRKLAQAKLTTLDRLPVRLIGAVLNDIQPDGMYKYYSYLDGYGTLDEDEPAALAGAGTGGPKQVAAGE